MRRRLIRSTAAAVAALVVTLSALAAGAALDCVGHRDVERAAREALAGQHPLWADSYIVARLDRIEREPDEGLRLTVTPTHVFGPDAPPVTHLAARMDGPPDPGSWRLGAHYFLSLSDAPELRDADALVSPCAPNFRIADADQLAGLIAAAPSVMVVEPHVTAASATPIPLLALGAVIVGLAALLAFRRHRSVSG